MCYCACVLYLLLFSFGRCLRQRSTGSEQLQDERRCRSVFLHVWNVLSSLVLPLDRSDLTQPNSLFFSPTNRKPPLLLLLLAAHENNAKSRIKDANLIVNNMNLPNKSKIGSPTYGTIISDVTTRFDCVFWCGDMNWRWVDFT